MKNIMTRLKQKLQVRREEAASSLLKDVSEDHNSFIISSDALFKLLSISLYSIIKAVSFELMHFVLSEISIKFDVITRIRCEILIDIVESHTIRDDDKKERAEKSVFLSYENDKKFAHLNDKYDEISVLAKI